MQQRAGRATRPTNGQVIFIIELPFTTPELGALESWVINEELATSSDHELIVFDTANLYETIGSMGTSQEVTEWAIKVMSEYKLEPAQGAWQDKTAGRGVIQDRCSTKEIERRQCGLKLA